MNRDDENNRQRKVDINHQNASNTRSTVLMRTVTDTKFSKLNRWNELFYKIKSIDVFGRPIAFTYEYEETYKTIEGAVLTIMIMVTMIAITGLYLQNMLNRTE